MAFIDIFNFKKYFDKPSDSQVARYGHVNALYDTLYTDFANGANFSKGAYTTDDLGDTVNITTLSGTITFNTPGTIGPGSSGEVILTSPLIKADSIVIFNVSTILFANTNTQAPPVLIEDGQATIRIYNTGSSSVNVTAITFLIIP